LASLKPKPPRHDRPRESNAARLQEVNISQHRTPCWCGAENTGN
jgi:hypothetical protein